MPPWVTGTVSVATPFDAASAVARTIPEVPTRPTRTSMPAGVEAMTEIDSALSGTLTCETSSCPGAAVDVLEVVAPGPLAGVAFDDELSSAKLSIYVTPLPLISSVCAPGCSGPYFWLNELENCGFCIVPSGPAKLIVPCETPSRKISALPPLVLFAKLYVIEPN